MRGQGKLLGTGSCGCGICCQRALPPYELSSLGGLGGPPAAGPVPRGSMRLVWHFAWQQEAALHAYVDTDYAGCHVTRRSTSDGMIFRGAHIIKQKHVTLSSGEAELGGVVKGAAEKLGVQSLASNVGLQVKLAVHADSSAAIGICRRSDIGRVQHLARLLSPCTRSALIAILHICAPSILGVQLLTIYSALLGYTLRPVEQVARHLCPPRLSCFQQVGEPSTDVTRLTPNDEEECETVELNLCRLCCMRRAWREVPNSP